MSNDADTAISHYEYDEREHFRNVKGYEYHVKMAEATKNSAQTFRDLFCKTQVYGTPEKCVAYLCFAFQIPIDPPEAVNSVMHEPVNVFTPGFIGSVGGHSWAKPFRDSSALRFRSSGDYDALPFARKSFGGAFADAASHAGDQS